MNHRSCTCSATGRPKGGPEANQHSQHSTSTGTEHTRRHGSCGSLRSRAAPTPTPPTPARQYQRIQSLHPKEGAQAAELLPAAAPSPQALARFRSGPAHRRAAARTNHPNRLSGSNRPNRPRGANRPGGWRVTRLVGLRDLGQLRYKR